MVRVDLVPIRSIIDGIDDDIAVLVRRRLILSSIAGGMKASLGVPIRDDAREAEIASRFEEGPVRDVARFVAAACRNASVEAALRRPDDG